MMVVFRVFTGYRQGSQGWCLIWLTGFILWDVKAVRAYGIGVYSRDNPKSTSVKAGSILCSTHLIYEYRVANYGIYFSDPPESLGRGV